MKRLLLFTILLAGCQYGIQRYVPAVHPAIRELSSHEGFISLQHPNSTQPMVFLECIRTSFAPTIGIHTQFITFDPEQAHPWYRWSVSFSSNKNKTVSNYGSYPNYSHGVSWGHIRNMKVEPVHLGIHRKRPSDKLVRRGDELILENWDGPTPESINKVGSGNAVIHKWEGKEAASIIETLQKTLEIPNFYPYQFRYWYWPGPNSNTFTQWVLKKSKVSYDMHPMAIGKDYLGLLGASLSPTRTGIQIETPLLGAKIGWKDGFEIHVLSLTVGVDIWPLALKLPFGRFGFS